VKLRDGSSVTVRAVEVADHLHDRALWVGISPG